MLGQRGVAPVSDSIREAGLQKCGQTSGAGLWHIVSAFRAEKAAAAHGESEDNIVDVANKGTRVMVVPVGLRPRRMDGQPMTK